MTRNCSSRSLLVATVWLVCGRRKRWACRQRKRTPMQGTWRLEEGRVGYECVHEWSSRVWRYLYKQKTGYEMRISDMISDVCSSDLLIPPSALFRLVIVSKPQDVP